MSDFIEGECRRANAGLKPLYSPEALDAYMQEDNPVRVIDVFVDGFALYALGFKTEPADTGLSHSLGR